MADASLEDAACSPWPHLPEDVLFFLSKYLNPRSSMAVALSDAFEGFDVLLGGNRKHIISQCFFLTPNSWSRFFQQNVIASSVTVFDASHCYWLGEQLLLDGILQMANLEELCINDTKITLSHLPQVFPVCDRITKLSVSLVEKTLCEFEEQPLKSNQVSINSIMMLGFQKLTHLKIFTFALNARYYTDLWPVTLGVLKWCRDCTDLLIEVAYTRDYFNYGMMYDSADHDDEVIREAHEELFPHLGWMTSLKSFAFIKRGSHRLPHDVFVAELINWIFTQEQTPESLERLWIQEDSVAPVLSDDQLASPSIKSLYLGDNLRLDLNHERYHDLQHLGGMGFSRLVNYPDLKYARGYCIDEEGLSEFCQLHPMLEHLHFDSNYHTLRGYWRLVHLKTLVYCCGSPVKEVVDQFMDSCPNIESLHIGDYCGSGSVSSDGVDFLSAIRFSRLTSLSLSGFDLFDGAFVPLIVKQCPKLETLHISGTFGPSTFFSKLGQCLPKAINLRDFRLQWDHQESGSDVLLLLKSLLKCSSHLERLVLYEQELKYSNTHNWEPPLDIVDILVNFISKMGHLVAFCLTALRLDPSIVEEIKRRVAEEILPDRPSFWLHLDLDLPKENDPSIPRIHYDQIVNPLNYFDAPPSF